MHHTTAPRPGFWQRRYLLWHYPHLDDAELATQLARGLRSRGYGRHRAARTLRQRRLPGDVAEAALDGAYAAEEEETLALAALGARAVDDDDARRRAVAFLVRRGFSAAAAWHAVGRARSRSP